MIVVDQIDQVRQHRRMWQEETVAVVPTMGALHEGHLSLVERAKSLASKVVVTIFINPLQFGMDEDFRQYPRTKAHDLSVCEHHGVDMVFYPDTAELYPEGLDHLSKVVPSIELTEQLCGLNRPGHFTGVTTVVMKLFNIIQPQLAVFGEKDAQQLAIIKRMVQDLNLPVEIVPSPTIRDADGLAKSSRNVYLDSGSLRQQARLLYRLLLTAQQFYSQGHHVTTLLLEKTLDHVVNSALYPDFELEYFEAVDEATFLPTQTLDDTTRLLVAAQLGEVRLIDNTLISVPLSPQVAEAPSAVMVR